ncbi:MAG: ribonuclease Y [Planctomycetota bacterium]|nr:ribonuclease Y [Planctomycetota bacterium]MDI6787126.1 ribonuclease Y [Planctomycetota bacterium]
MSIEYETLLLIAGSFILGAGIVYLFIFIQQKKTKQKAKDIITSAQNEADKIKKEATFTAKEETYRIKEQTNREINETRYELKGFERRLLKREDAIDRKADMLQRREQQIENMEKSIAEKNNLLSLKNKELESLVEKEKQVLQQISGLSREEATRIFLSRLEAELQKEEADLIKKHQERSKEMGESEARKIINIAIQKYASDQSGQSSVSTVDIMSDDMKGRIIGREGRNIRAFEKASGVELIVDDTPGVVIISSFDPLRREVARRALEKLMADGRIQPGRIEEVVELTKKELNDVITQSGNQTCYEMNIPNINPKLVSLLGRLKFRTSYGQNVLQHSIEVAYLASAMAAELGLDSTTAKRAGLLHDIGKAIDHVEEGTHPSLGADLARRCEERPEIVDAIEKHHETINLDMPYTLLISAADAISASRPGARRDTVEKYLQRIKQLEGIANAYQGVETSYAIQAGREIRIFVNASKVDDSQATILSRNIAQDIERELKYPGEIKVAVIRETRAIEYAR